MRSIVNDSTPTFVLPTMRHGVPIAKTGKGRAKKPLNPALVAMQPGQSFIVTGETTVKAMIGDIGRIRKARAGEVEFVTRNLGGKADPETFETYPAFALGVWCVAAKVVANDATEAGRDPNCPLEHLGPCRHTSLTDEESE